MADSNTELNEKDVKTLKEIIKEKTIGKFTLTSYTHPLFRTMDEWVKRYGPFVLKNAKQPADINGFMIAQGGTTKMPADTSIGSLSMPNNNQKRS